jgi:hypothetical protein
MFNVRGIEEGEEGVPCWVELVVARFDEDGGIWGGEDGVPEEMSGFFAVGCGWLLQKYVFSGGEGFEGPFVVETDGEGVVDAVDGWVVDKVWGI